jgi:hypothetical protein
MTCTITDGAGRLIQYRRDHSFPGVLMLECRLLRPDGAPHDSRWYRVDDAHHHSLQRDKCGRDVVAALTTERAQ